MLETDETGQKKLEELLKHRDQTYWTDWEQEFLDDLSDKRTKYSALSPKQKSVISRLHDKFFT